MKILIVIFDHSDHDHWSWPCSYKKKINRYGQTRRFQCIVTWKGQMQHLTFFFFFYISDKMLLICLYLSLITLCYEINISKNDFFLHISVITSWYDNEIDIGTREGNKSWSPPLSSWSTTAALMMRILSISIFNEHRCFHTLSFLPNQNSFK